MKRGIYKSSQKITWGMLRIPGDPVPRVVDVPAARIICRLYRTARQAGMGHDRACADALLRLMNQTRNMPYGKAHTLVLESVAYGLQEAPAWMRGDPAKDDGP